MENLTGGTPPVRPLPCVVPCKLYFEIEETARDRIDVIMSGLMKQYGITEELKAENQMEWVRQMNACKAQADEIVKAELIYD